MLRYIESVATGNLRRHGLTSDRPMFFIIFDGLDTPIVIKRTVRIMEEYSPKFPLLGKELFLQTFCERRGRISFSSW